MVNHVDIPLLTYVAPIEYIFVLIDFEWTQEITICLFDDPIYHKHVVRIDLKAMTLHSELTSIFIWIHNS